MNRLNMTRYAVTHPVGIIMIVLFFVTLGLYSYYRLGVELYPKINTPYVVVSVTYDGADAESVEQQVTKPVEDALSSVSDVKHITSKSRTGKSQVTLELNFDADMDAAAVDASQKVNAIRKSLPDDADDPVVEKRDMDAAPILDLALVSPHPLDEMYSLADNTLTNDFTKADGVSDVELSGGRDPEIAVKIDRDKLSYYGISMNDIISALKRENKLAPAGSSYTDRRQTQIRLNAQYHSVEDIKKIYVTAQGGGAFRLELRGNNMEDLILASEKVQDMLKQGDYGITDVSSTYQEGLPELSIVPDREKLKYYGVTVGSLYDTLSSAISGSGGGVLPNDVKNSGNDTDINVYFRGGESYKKSDLAVIPIETSKGLVHISDVAQVKDEEGPITINRTDKQRSIIIGGNPGSRPLSQVIEEVTNDLEGAGLPETVSFRFSGQADSMNESFTELLVALLMGMVLVYMVLSVLYESAKTSFIRMFSLPFGLIGSLFFLFLMNDSLNIYSMIGIIVMDGVVAKNGTLLLDYTLTLMHTRGMNPKDAVLEAGRTRLRPILMTTFTMIVGMLPTALAVTAGSETRRSMAWVIIGGLLTSTIFTLLVMPMIFLFFENHSFLHFLKKKEGRVGAAARK